VICFQHAVDGTVPPKMSAEKKYTTIFGKSSSGNDVW